MEKELDQEQRQTLNEFYRMVGRAEMANAFEGISRMARIRLLKGIQESKVYKLIPGCSTMRDVFDKLGIAKTTGYEELKALELLGDQTVELLIELGITSRDSYMLAKALDSGGDGEFEVLDKESGEFRVGGQVVSMDGDRGLISSALLKAIQRVKLEQDARRGKEQELEEKKDEIETLRAKIKKGSEQVTDYERRLKGEQLVTPIGKLLPEFVLVVGRILNEEVLEEDEQYIDNYLNIIEGQYGKLLEKFRHFLPEGM